MNFMQKAKKGDAKQLTRVYLKSGGSGGKSTNPHSRLEKGTSIHAKLPSHTCTTQNKPGVFEEAMTRACAAGGGHDSKYFRPD